MTTKSKGMEFDDYVAEIILDHRIPRKIGVGSTPKHRTSSRVAPMNHLQKLSQGEMILGNKFANDDGDLNSEKEPKWS